LIGAKNNYHMSRLDKERQKRAGEKIGFYRHLRSYLVVNVIMFFVVLFNNGDLGWLSVAMLWGIGLAIHYLKVFGLPGAGGALSREWERKLLEKEGALPGAPRDEEERLDLPELDTLKKRNEKSWDERDLV
jgi:hypothetical protein